MRLKNISKKIAFFIKILTFYRIKFSIAVGCALILLSTPFFFSFDKITAQNTVLPNCADLDDSVNADAGTNCLYYNKPLCKNSTLTPRLECMDLVDIPLCNTIEYDKQKPGKNCVKSCSEVENPIFNKNCIKFCDEFTTKTDAKPGENCAQRKCHQLDATVEPQHEGKATDNCGVISCNLLFASELNQPKFNYLYSLEGASQYDNKYCSNETKNPALSSQSNPDGIRKLKCFEYDETQLPYVKPGFMCDIHNCPPPLNSKNCTETDEITLIKNKGTSYVNYYQQYILSGNLLSSSLCLPSKCAPPIIKSMRCTTDGSIMSGDASKDIIPNNLCDMTGDGSICDVNNLCYRTISCNDFPTTNKTTIYYECNNFVANSNCDKSGEGSLCVASNNKSYCYKTVDCNNSSNASLKECIEQKNECSIFNNAPNDSKNTSLDPFNSWFFRPAPLTKATNTSTGLLLPMTISLDKSKEEDRFCYSERQIRNQGWGRSYPIISWFHDYLSDGTRSPGACNEPRAGNRGQTYGYLCDVNGNLFKSPRKEDTLYFKGYATTDFTKTVPKHKITLCLRFENTMVRTKRTCGKRECGITAGFGDIWSQNCGDDVCRDVYIDESDNTECMMDKSMSEKDEKQCAQTIDKYLRVRAVKYGNKICGFLDSKGQLAYKPNNFFMDGKQSVKINARNDKICVNDLSSMKPDGSIICDGYDSNSYPETATLWRAVLRGEYISNNRPYGTDSDQLGYLDHTGKLYKMQSCAKVTMRIPPPNLYNLATVNNSEKLFGPSLRILTATRGKNMPDSTALEGELYGKTDFHIPEMKIKFGNSIYIANLDADEIQSPDTKITTTAYSRIFNTEIYVTKEYDRNSKTPLFCLYNKSKDINGDYLAPVRVGCINRDYPEIDNKKLADVTSYGLDYRKVIVSRNSISSYSNTEMIIKFLAGAGNDKKANNCQSGSDDVCTRSISLGNLSYINPTCSQELEQYEICVQREECTKLNVECILNEVSMSNAAINNQDISTFKKVRKECDQMVNYCNAKKGIKQDSMANLMNPNPGNFGVDPKAYGWFNELCINSGFETKLKDVVAYKPSSNIMGKCVISNQSPYLLDSDPNTNCSDGGNAPNCLCVEYIDGYILPDSQYVRKQTPHEAGLCIDLVMPKQCSPINYTPIINSIANDPYYVDYSLGGTVYGDNISEVHSSHKNRTLNSYQSGHGDFKTAIIGMTNIQGQCNGYWKYSIDSNGNELKPTMDCTENLNGLNGKWSEVRNPCVRFSCPAVREVDAYNSFNGYAIWERFTKSENSDFKETVYSESCVTGYKLPNSAPITQNGKIIGYEKNSSTNSIARQCLQNGSWQAAINMCQKIECPEINPDRPILTDPNDVRWGTWNRNGGATFAKSEASNNKITGKVVYGNCNKDLGYFQMPGSLPPSRECDYLGNWSEVRNVCVTQCKQVTAIEANSENNGFATWDGVPSSVEQETQGVFTGCISGYQPNPYKGNPTRTCKYPPNVSTTMVWGAVSNPCINKCPGYNTDPTENIGFTSHKTKAAGTIQIKWNDTNFGAYDYQTNWNSEFSQINASIFDKTKNPNDFYLLRRKCGFDGKWEDPEAMCAINDGIVGKAKYFDSRYPNGFSNSIVAGSSDTTKGQCLNRYTTSSQGKDPAPQLQCINNEYIDLVSLELANNTKDCELKVCPNYPGYLGTAATIYATSSNRPDDERFAAGSGKLTGYCLNNVNNSASVKVYNSLPTSQDAPSVLCQEDGTWSKVQNEANCKKGCDANQIVYRLNSKGCGNGDTFTIPARTLVHGQIIQFHAHSYCSDYDSFSNWSHGEICQDGVILSQDYFSGYGDFPCQFKYYDATTNSFGSLLNCGADNGPVGYNFVNIITGQTYYDKFNQTRTLTIPRGN